MEKCYMCNKLITGEMYICDNDCGVVFCSNTCAKLDDHECSETEICPNCDVEMTDVDNGFGCEKCSYFVGQCSQCDKLSTNLKVWGIVLAH